MGHIRFHELAFVMPNNTLLASLAQLAWPQAGDRLIRHQLTRTPLALTMTVLLFVKPKEVIISSILVSATRIRVGSVFT
jgi:hypothetical protein